MKKEIIIHSSSTSSMKLMIFGGLIVMIGSYVLDLSDNVLVQILGILNLILGFVSVVLGFLSIFHIKPKITFNDLGIKDSRILKDFISWDEIDKAGLIYEQNQNKLLISLRKEVDFSNFSFLYKSFKSKKSNQFQKELKFDLSSCEVNYGELLLFLNEKNLHTF